jgi:hypothetical protein
VALALSAIGFGMSRGYDAVVARAGYVVLDYYLGVAMTVVHLGFVLALGVLAGPWLVERAAPSRPGLPIAALVLAMLTFLWA